MLRLTTVNLIMLLNLKLFPNHAICVLKDNLPQKYIVWDEIFVLMPQDLLENTLFFLLMTEPG